MWRRNRYFDPNKNGRSSKIRKEKSPNFKWNKVVLSRAINIVPNCPKIWTKVKIKNKSLKCNFWKFWRIHKFILIPNLFLPLPLPLQLPPPLSQSLHKQKHYLHAEKDRIEEDLMKLSLVAVILSDWWSWRQCGFYGFLGVVKT